MNNPEVGRPACDLLQQQLASLSPLMTFRVSPRSADTGGFRIYGQHTKNMRYDRANHFATCELSTEDYGAAAAPAQADTLLRSIVAKLETQLG